MSITRYIYIQTSFILQEDWASISVWFGIPDVISPNPSKSLSFTSKCLLWSRLDSSWIPLLKLVCCSLSLMISSGVNFLGGGLLNFTPFGARNLYPTISIALKKKDGIKWFVHLLENKVKQSCNDLPIFIGCLVKNNLKSYIHMLKYMIDQSFLFVQNFILQLVFCFRTTTRGHIPHLREQFKSIYTYDYIIMLIKRRKPPLSSFWELNSSSFEQTWISSTQRCFRPNLVEIGPVVLVLEKKIFKIRQFQYFVIISLQKRQGHSFEQARIPFIRGCSVQNLFEIGPVQFWRRRFLNFVNAFLLFCYYLPLEGARSFIWTNLNPLHPKILCAKLAQWFWREDF